MKTIAFYHLKGGVGKTAAAVNVAYLAAQSNKPILLWDMDPQGSASWHFNASAPDNTKLSKLLKGKSSIGKLIKQTEYPNLDIIPAGLNYRNYDSLVTEHDANEFVEAWTDRLSEDYALVIIDCAPSLSAVSESIFAAVDYLFVPLIPSHLSFQTYEKLLGFLQEHKIKTKKVRPFFSLVDRRKTLHKEFLSHPPIQLSKQLSGYIPYAADVEKMGVYRKPVAEFAPKSTAALAFKLMWQDIQKLIKI